MYLLYICIYLVFESQFTNTSKHTTPPPPPPKKQRQKAKQNKTKHIETSQITFCHNTLPIPVPRPYI